MYMLIKLNACRRTCSRAVYTEGDVINPVSIGCRSTAQAKVVNNFLFTLHSDNSEAPERHDIRLGAGPSLHFDNQPHGQLWAVMLHRVARWRCISLKVFLIQFVRGKKELCRSHGLLCHFTLVSSHFPTWMSTV